MAQSRWRNTPPARVDPPTGDEQAVLTKDGRELRRQLMGLERFVTASEADRISWLQNPATARSLSNSHLHAHLD